MCAGDMLALELRYARARGGRGVRRRAASIGRPP